MNRNERIIYTLVSSDDERNHYEACVETNGHTDGTVYRFDAVKTASKKGIARKARRAVNRGLLPVHRNSETAAQAAE